MIAFKTQEEHRLSGFKAFIVYTLAFFVKILMLSLRLRTKSEDYEILSNKEANALFFIWHNRFLFTISIRDKFNAKLPMYGVVSPSRDGAYLTKLFEFFGIGALRGSSSKNGVSVAKKMIKALEEGNNICLTPDGPRGPKYKFKGASLNISRKTNKRMIFMRAYPQRFIKLKSWDNFLIPIPFTKVDVKATTFDNYADFAEKANSLGYKEEDYAQVLLGSDDFHSDNKITTNK